MPNAKDAELNPTKRILVVGKTGSGKTSQIWSLPGRKFLYVFDPNAMSTLKGCDVDYEEFYPDFLEMDATLKGFNKGSKSDHVPLAGSSRKKPEPHVYMNWVADINKKVDDGFFKNYDWLCIDSATFLSKACMDRQLFINNRYGDIEDLADYRVVGSKLADIFNSLAGYPINMYLTGHLSTFQDDKTKKVETQIYLPGKARSVLPLLFTDVWLAHVDEGEKGVAYKVRTRPEPRGFQELRCSIQGLETVEDVTLKGFSNPASGGIGALLNKVPKSAKVVVSARA